MDSISWVFKTLSTRQRVLNLGREVIWSNSKQYLVKWANLNLAQNNWLGSAQEQGERGNADSWLLPFLAQKENIKQTEIVRMHCDTYKSKNHNRRHHLTATLIKFISSSRNNTNWLHLFINSLHIQIGRPVLNPWDAPPLFLVITFSSRIIFCFRGSRSSRVLSVLDYRTEIAPKRRLEMDYMLCHCLYIIKPGQILFVWSILVDIWAECWSERKSFPWVTFVGQI